MALNLDIGKFGNILAWTLTGKGIKDNNGLAKLGIWMHASYRCYNFQRTHEPGMSDPEIIFRALQQWMKEAVRKIGEVAAQVNEAIREKERTEELFEMQQSLKGLGGRTLMDHERRFGVHKPPSPHSLTARQVTCSSDMFLCRRWQ